MDEVAAIQSLIEGMTLTALRQIGDQRGAVLHMLRCDAPDFNSFGECYFSEVMPGAVKAWKLHRRMTLNLVVPLGEVRFVFRTEDGRAQREEVIGVSNYVRLTVPPGVWFGLQGLAEPFSLVLNVADIPHEPEEVMSQRPEDFDYAWEKAR